MSRKRVAVVTMGAVEGSDEAAFEGACLSPPYPIVEVPVGDFRVAVPVDSSTLLMALVMVEPMRNEVRDALVDNLLQQVPRDDFQKLTRHLDRWALMRRALDVLHLSWDDAPEWCARQLSKKGQRVSTATVLRSYNKVEADQRRFGRGRPRTHRRR
jgi:hypothetical protein